MFMAPSVNSKLTYQIQLEVGMDNTRSYNGFLYTFRKEIKLV